MNFMKNILSLMIILLCAMIAAAQSSSLSGQVTDANGSVIANAEVTAIAKDKAVFRSRVDRYGVYNIKLPGGAYRIEFVLVGCKNFVVPEYVIEKNTNAVLDAEIPAGTCEAADTTDTTDATATADTAASAAGTAGIAGQPVSPISQLSELPQNPDAAGSKYVDHPYVKPAKAKSKRIRARAN
jgi:hypothetical protein